MAEFNFVDYFKNIAEKLKEIKHTTARPAFGRVSSVSQMEEFLMNQYKTAETVLLVQDDFTGRFDNSVNLENLLDNRFCVFFILKKVKSNDYDDRQAKVKVCKAILHKIFSKLLKDKKEDYNGSNTNGLADLDIGSPVYDTIGPIGDGFQGISVNFTLKETLIDKLVYNADDWES